MAAQCGITVLKGICWPALSKPASNDSAVDNAIALRNEDQQAVKEQSSIVLATANPDHSAGPNSSPTALATLQAAYGCFGRILFAHWFLFGKIVFS
jgi:hypothetical protein